MLKCVYSLNMHRKRDCIINREKLDMYCLYYNKEDSQENIIIYREVKKKAFLIDIENKLGKMDKNNKD